MDIDFNPTSKPFTEARTLPGEAYCSSDLFDVEKERIFTKAWLNIARVSDIPNSGDYLVRDVFGTSILITRDRDGCIHAHYNVCRHRGSQLLNQPCGKTNRIVCPYHAWSYDCDGSLQSAPRMDESFDKSEWSLHPIQVAEYQGFVFINLDPNAVPLVKALEELPDLSRFQMGELHVGKRIEYTVEANWKLICENYCECYHCPGAHPQLHKLSDVIARTNRVQELGNCFNGGPMILRDGIQTMSMTGKSTLPVIPGLSPDDMRHVYYYLIYPHWMLSPHPDYVMSHTAWPISPGRTRVVCEWLFPAETIQSPGFDPSDIVDFWDITNKQDWKLCENVQLSASSPSFRPGPYHPTEDCLHAFDLWYVRQIGANVSCVASFENNNPSGYARK